MSRFGYKQGVGLVLSKRGFGTREFMAPEALRCRLEYPKKKGSYQTPIKYDTFKGNDDSVRTFIQYNLHIYFTPGDVWALGVSLYLMLTQCQPYEVPENDNIPEYIEPLKILEKGVLSRKTLKTTIGDDDKLKDLLLAMMELDPDKHSLQRRPLGVHQSGV